jgi:hypothetical protein
VRGLPWWLWCTRSAQPYARPTVVHDDDARAMLALMD